MQRILGLDLASRTTGYALVSEKGKLYKSSFGLIKSESGTIEERYNIFLDELDRIIKKHKPTLIIVEYTPMRSSFTTNRILSGFEAIVRYHLFNAGHKYRVVDVNTIRKCFKLKTKEEAFQYVISKYKLKDFTFDKHNDITDAIMCALYGVRLLKETR
jgi:Holliday junction resolvasome RuvABC endonuclease subunit